MRGLYAIVDTGALQARNVDPLKFAEAILASQPAALQLRAKDMPAREVLALLRALAPMCHRHRVPLVANDRADLAAFAGCDMVHVGQEDISIDLVRRLAPGLGVGVSTHNMEQLTAALATRPTYVAFGPIYATTSKASLDRPVGIAGLRDACAAARASGVPLVAIGGITLERVSEVAPHCDAVAVIAALIASSGDVVREAQVRAKALRAALVPPASTEASA
jgi:thiamine-phosphate pyrophosphorylase